MFGKCSSWKASLALLFPRGSHTSDHSLVLLLGVLEEAEFYNIASLVRLVKERIRDNENRTSQVRCLELLRTKPVEAAVCLSAVTRMDAFSGLESQTGSEWELRGGGGQNSPSPSGECYCSTVAMGRPPPGHFRTNVCSQACSPPRACTPLPQPS